MSVASELIKTDFLPAISAGGGPDGVPIAGSMRDASTVGAGPAPPPKIAIGLMTTYEERTPGFPSVVSSDGRNLRGVFAEELCAFDEIDFRGGKFGFEAVEDGDGVRRRAAVVAHQDFGLIGERADDGDF